MPAYVTGARNALSHAQGLCRSRAADGSIDMRTSSATETRHHYHHTASSGIVQFDARNEEKLF
jgi:hypothetical protein